MLIGIDAHSLEKNRTGVGRVLFNLVKVWSADYRLPTTARFVLYFKDEIPADMPKAQNFEFKLLGVKSTAKFIHWDLARAAKKDKVDVLFCPGYVAPICYKGKIALTLHDIIYEAHPEWFHWQSWADKILLKWVSKKSAQKASVIFACSEHTKREIKKYFKVPDEKIVVAELAVDEELKNADSNANETQIKRLGILNKFAFFAGSIFDRRHLPEVIGAFSRLAEEKQDLQFLISGKDNTDKKNIDSLIDSANEDLKRKAILRVDFVGDSDLKLMYGACAFFIYLSDYEGFGLPPLEAMSLGAPVITSDSTSLKEVAGNAVLLVKNNSDEEEIYQAMKRMAEDNILREDLIRKGYEQEKKFSWEKCAKIVLEAMIKA